MNQVHYKKIRQVLYVLAGISFSIYLFIDAMSEGLHLYKTPSEVIEDNELAIYLGGKVVEGSLSQEQSTVVFQVADDKHAIWVSYKGTLPAMFKEGRDTVLTGTFHNNVFHAKQVMAKHDEYYRAGG